MSNSVWPHRWQPTRLPHPWDSPGKNTGVGCHFLLQGMKVKSESEVAQSCPTLSDPMDRSLPGSQSMRFSRQEYWSGVPLPSHESEQTLGDGGEQRSLVCCSPWGCKESRLKDWTTTKETSNTETQKYMFSFRGNTIQGKVSNCHNFKEVRKVNNTSQ